MVVPEYCQTMNCWTTEMSDSKVGLSNWSHYVKGIVISTINLKH